MVQQHRLRKGDEQQQQQQQQQHGGFCDDCACWGSRKGRLRLLFAFSLASCSLLFGSRRLLGGDHSPFPFSIYSSCASGEASSTSSGIDGGGGGGLNGWFPCSSVPDNSICCDRTSSVRTDVCVLRGDVRTRSSASSIFLYAASPSSLAAPNPASSGRRVVAKRTDGSPSVSAVLVEKIRPYTRKWETSVMDTIAEVSLVARADHAGATHKCDVVHGVPAIVFSTGGYTGNVYHEFNDGIIPLYITSHHLNCRVVFVVLEYHSWWVTKYGDILSRISAYPPVVFSQDNRTHCFSDVTVGLRIHDELAIDAALMHGHKTVLDFRRLLDDAYRPRIRSLEQEERQERGEKAAPESGEEGPPQAPSEPRPPRLVIISRKGSRGIENERELAALCEEIGFQVTDVRPDRTTELAKIYRALNDSDAMIGVHGAAMTHLLFMRPGSVFIQVVPLGTDWAAQTYYGDPARRMGLRYMAYKVLPRESSLRTQYPEDDPVLRNPESITSQGWQMTKKVYLDGQTVKLDLNRFLNHLTRAYRYAASRKMADASLSWNENWLPAGRRRGRPAARC